MYRIGYIDEDSGWRNTFRQFFKDDFDIYLFEINYDTTVESLVEDIFSQAIDVLVIDFRLDETGVVDFNADALVVEIQERNLYYPLIILTSHESDALDHIDNANLINGKDMLSGDYDSKIPIFKQKLAKIASEYRSKLKNNQDQLEILEKKRLLEGLSPAEEDQFVELNAYVNKTISANERLSRSFYSQDTNRKLDELIKKTEDLLSKLLN